MLTKVNPHARSRSAIFRMSGTSSFESFINFVHAQCYMPLGGDSLSKSFASCVLVIDDVHHSVENCNPERRALSNICEVIRNLVQNQQLVIPIKSAEQSRLLKSNGKSFLQFNASHVCMIATAKKSSIVESIDSSVPAIPFAKLCWSDPCEEIIRHIFTKTVSYHMLHIDDSVCKAFVEHAASATMHVMYAMRKHSVMSQQIYPLDNLDTSRIAFVTTGEEVYRDFKKGRGVGGRKWLKVEKRSGDGTLRLQLLLSVSSEAGSAATHHVITSVHAGVPQGWDKEASSVHFYFVVDKLETILCESERANDWVLGVNCMLTNLKSVRECVREEWKCDTSEKLPVGVTFDLQRLGTVMSYLSAACASASNISQDNLWVKWQCALEQAFCLDQSAIHVLQKSLDAAASIYSPIQCNSTPANARSNIFFDASRDPRKLKSSSTILSKSVLKQMLSVSPEHIKLIYRSPSILEFTDNLATLLNCRRVVVECSSIDETSTAVVAVACESLGHFPVIFSRFDSTNISEARASIKPLRSFHDCLRTCIRSVCSEKRSAVLIMTAEEFTSLHQSCAALHHILDDGNCSELFSSSEISELALDAEGDDEIPNKTGFSASLIQRLRGPKYCRAVEELHEYDHVVPLFGLGREVLSSASFFLGSTTARGRVMLGKNATGGSARLDAILHARLTHDIKLLILAKSGNYLDNTSSVSQIKSLMKGDTVAAKLPSLSSEQIFNDMLPQISIPIAQTSVDSEAIGPYPSVVCEALRNSYTCALTHVPNIDSCLTFHVLEQFKTLFEGKLGDRQSAIDEEKSLTEFEESQHRLISVYQQHEETLMRQRAIAKADVECVLQSIIALAANISRNQQIMSKHTEHTDLLQSKMQCFASTVDSFSSYCHNMALKFQEIDFATLLDVDLDIQQELVLDAAAILLSSPVGECCMKVTPNGLLLHAPSHPLSLNTIIALQDEGVLASSISRLGQMDLNEEISELLLPITDALVHSEPLRKDMSFLLIKDLVQRYITEVNSLTSKEREKEIQSEAAADVLLARTQAQEMQKTISALQEQVFHMNGELDSKMSSLQSIQNDLSAVQSLLSRFASAFVELQSIKAEHFTHNDVANQSDLNTLAIAASSTEMNNLQTVGTSTEDTQYSALLVQHCASLAVFTVFGGLLESEPRMNFLASLHGIGTFPSCKMHDSYQDQQATHSRSYDFVNAVADDATQMMWQQCGVPAHHELFTSVALLMVSAKTPFVFDKSGVVIEFLRHISTCNHSSLHDKDAMCSPPEFHFNGENSKVLIRSTSDFPAFVRSCAASAACTGRGVVQGAGCVIITLLDLVDALDKVISACSDGCVLVLRIPAQASHASAAFQSLISLIPLLLLPKIRKDFQTVQILGRIVTVNVRFTCVIVNESGMQPLRKLAPLLSVVQFTPSSDALQQLLLRAFVVHSSKSLVTSLSVMQQRFLCYLVENDETQLKLLQELNCLCAFAGNHLGPDAAATADICSNHNMNILSENLKKIESSIDTLKNVQMSLSRVQSLMMQLNSSLAELLPYTSVYRPPLSLAAVSSGINIGVTNMYYVLFSLLHSSLVETASSNSSPNKRNKSTNTPGPGANVASSIFRALCSLIPQDLRLPTSMCALQDWMGGQDGLKLLVDAPLPSSFHNRRIVKTQQSVPSVAATSNGIASASSAKTNANPPKKSGKGSTSSTVVSNVSVPDSVQHFVHLGPAWLPVDKYERLKKVPCALFVLRYDGKILIFSISTRLK
jgi:hypothetical protein